MPTEQGGRRRKRLRRRQSKTFRLLTFRLSKIKLSGIKVDYKETGYSKARQKMNPQSNAKAPCPNRFGNIFLNFSY